jgi:hypothetical protein
LETATDCGSILLQVRAGGFLTVAPKYIISMTVRCAGGRP